MNKREFTIPCMDEMNEWTLSFNDEADELRYLREIKENIHIPLPLRLVRYVGITHHCLYRLFVLYAVIAGLDIPAATLYQEIFLTCYLFLTLGIEIAISSKPYFKSVRGCLCYICFSTLTVITAFVTQKAPRFGLA
jgi:hypothetical protein